MSVNSQAFMVLISAVVLGISRLLRMCMENAMAPHSSTLAWKIPWTEEPGRLQSMGLLGVGHDWATSLSLHWRRKWQPTPVFLPGESQGQGAAVYGVARSRTQLKWLSSSSIKNVHNPLFFRWHPEAGHWSSLENSLCGKQKSQVLDTCLLCHSHH